MIITILLLMGSFLSGCATQYVPVKEIKPIIPSITPCPDLLLPTRTTIASSIIYNYGLYHICQEKMQFIYNWKLRIEQEK